MSDATTHSLGIIMNGVTGRMESTQHLKRSILPIIEEGGVQIGDDRTVRPDPVRIGRNAEKLNRLSDETGIDRWTTELEAALAIPDNEIYFDAQITCVRHESVMRALDAGKHVYCEKPPVLSTGDAVELCERWDEDGERYHSTADNAAYATVELDGGIVAQFNSSWTTRLRRDDLLTLQVDGTVGSAVAGLRTCRPTEQPFPWDLLEGAKEVQLTQKAYESAEKRTWLDLPSLVN